MRSFPVLLLAAACLAPAALPAQQRPLRLYSAPPSPAPPPGHGHGHGRPVPVLPVWWGPWGWGWGWGSGWDRGWAPAGWEQQQRPARRDTVPRRSAADSVRESLLRTRGVRPADPLLPWQVDERAARADSLPDPAYPAELENRRIPGRVLAQFVVDAAGRPDSASLRILLSTDRAFADAVRAWLPATRWRPARKGGRAVTAMVEETILFR